MSTSISMSISTKEVDDDGRVVKGRMGRSRRVNGRSKRSRNPRHGRDKEVF